MDRRRLDALLDAYGADPARWPADERAAATALLRAAPDTRARAAEASRLDALLDAATVAPPSDALRARVLAAAPGPGRHRAAPLGTRAPRLVRRVLVAALPLAAAAALWLTNAPVPRSGTSGTVDLAALDVYTTPTDALLAFDQVDTVDLVEDLPVLGCPDSALGCPDLDVLPEAQSRTTGEGRLPA